ncbi:Variant surface glycoprotein, partial [Trypanosoma congolense IL3000]
VLERGRTSIKVTLSIVIPVLHFTGVGTPYHNDEERRLLCDVLTAATGVLRNATHNRQLTEAIYGANGGTMFNRDGGIAQEGNCVGTLRGRSMLCVHHKNSAHIRFGVGNDGCFAKSLLGTFFCVCTPGDKDVETLCGVKGLKSVGTWSGSFRGNGLNQNLFKDVWKGLNRSCYDKRESENDFRDQLKNLRTSVETVKQKMMRSKRNGFAILGERTSIPCNGTTSENICAAYQAKDGEPYIPWVAKIEGALEELEETAKSINSAPASEAPRKGAIVPNGENEGAALVLQGKGNEEAPGRDARLPPIQRESDNQTSEKTTKGELTGNQGDYYTEPTKRTKRNPTTTQKRHSASCIRPQRRRLFPKTSHVATLDRLAQLTNKTSTTNFRGDDSLSPTSWATQKHSSNNFPHC